MARDSCEYDLHSLSELHQFMADYYTGLNIDAVYSTRHLTRKLKEKYGEHIKFAAVSGRKTIICFHNMSSFIVNDKWYSDRKSDIVDDSHRIIRVVAKLIASEIRDLQCHMMIYLATDEMHAIDSSIIPP